MPSRLEAAQANDEDPGFEPITVGAYLYEAWRDAGTCKRNAMGGLVALEWLDVWAYAQASGEVSEPWEMRAILDMSEAFVRGMREGENPRSRDPRERGKG